MERRTWIYASADEAEPHIRVTGPEDAEGEAVSDEMADFLQSHGVCMEFYAEYPDAQDYGSRAYVSDEVVAHATVAEHFAVHQEIRVSTKDRKDDGAAEFWFLVASPRSPTASWVESEERDSDVLIGLAASLSRACEGLKRATLTGMRVKPVFQGREDVKTCPISIE